MALKLSPDTDPDALVTQVAGEWEAWTQARRSKERIWDECVQHYLTHIDPSRYDAFPWRCQVADSFSQELADTLASQLRNLLFPINEDFFAVQGLDLLGEARAPEMAAFLKTQLKLSRFIEAVQPWLKQIAVIGNAPFLLTYRPLNRARHRRMMEIDPRTRRSRIVTSAHPGGQRQGVRFESLDAYDVAFDPSVLRAEESPMIRRMKVSRALLAQKADEWRLENLDQLDTDGASGPTEQADTLKRTRERLFGLTPDIEPAGEEEDIELLWRYGDLPASEGKSSQDYVIVIANRRVLARCEPHGFWAGSPLGWGGYDPMWNTGYHKGPLEPVRGTQELIDTFQCQKADVLNLIITGAFAYVDDGIIDPDLLFLKPMGGIPVGNINNIKPLQPANNVALSYAEIEQLRARGERSSGISRFDQGQAPGGRRTAYEANLIRSGGSTRLNDALRTIANGPLEYALNWMCWTNQQFKWNSGEISNQVLLGDYYVQFTGGDLSVVRQFETERQLMLIQVMAQWPELSAAVNKRALARKLLRNLAMDDPALINTEAQMQDELSAQQRLSERAAPQAGPTAPEGVVGGADEDLASLVQNLGG